ncbi:antibiotic biosynthesis monooxygenase [Pasteurellaceae bacterium USgator11]|nr:antibiotic biosynthesis monooxygenase [Pasteurellaceae bacterium UScroc12]TNG98077.1 antibiotic biosynthesis monooxygenase [Pasteurellaceae bacterium USgator41]TNG99021.1 antibiotic biosynthesis monooxygenase [Pasteurellaceae bacterium UScroc31]TNG99893.1 antibiotic biosynthesis monooxygenase [Pasteurellaceae bacterium USgator11]
MTLSKWLLATALATGTLAQAAPIVNLFELGVAAGKNADYQAVGEHNITTSLAAEAGTLAMYSVRSKADANLAYMFEIYADEAAYQAHLQSPQYQAFLQAVPSILTDRKQKTELVPRFLGDKKIAPGADTRTNLVVVEVKPQFNQDFYRLVSAEMQQSLQAENGVLAMYAATAKNAPQRWYFFEIYADEAAYQRHRQTPHFQHYLQTSAAMVQDKQFIQIQPMLLGNKGYLNFQAAPPQSEATQEHSK